MGIETIVIVLIAALVGGYVVAKSGGVASTATPTGPIAPHLQQGARLLSDSQIAEMERNIIGDHFTYESDNPRFITQALQDLANEQVSFSNNQCANGGQYAGQPLAITATKEGTLALGTAEGLASAGIFGGGGVGSLAGVGSSGFAAAGTVSATAIPIAGIVIGIGLSIYGAIAAHHAVAVRNEQGLECSLIPPANYSLTVIEKAVITGVITIQQGQEALNKLHQDFINSALNGQSGQLEDRPGKLNAMGWYSHFLHAIIIKKQNRYANLVS
jgi:hypothetical protein